MSGINVVSTNITAKPIVALKSVFSIPRRVLNVTAESLPPNAPLSPAEERCISIAMISNMESDTWIYGNKLAIVSIERKSIIVIKMCKWFL